MNQKRVLITIEPELHIEARRFAAQRKSNFSAFVCDALRMAMGSAGHPLVPPVPPTTSEEDENEPETPPPVASPARNGPCPCGSGAKYKRCCETVKGPEAMARPVPEGFRRLDQRPKDKDLCPCGSGYAWQICCKRHLPFVKLS